MFDNTQLAKMKAVSEDFYRSAVRVGWHQFLEFKGFMHEYLVMLENGTAKSYNGTYIAEKFDCIFGDWAREHSEFVQGFAGALANKGWPIRYARRIT
jgi:hypothetical protein